MNLSLKTNFGNADLLLNYNLLLQRIAHVIITANLLEFYHMYIKDKDYENLANLFKFQVVKENQVINKLWKKYHLNKEDSQSL